MSSRELTSKERIMASIKGQPYDRTAVTPIFMAWAAHFIGRTYRDYYLDGDVLVGVQSAVLSEAMSPVASGRENHLAQSQLSK